MIRLFPKGLHREGFAEGQLSVDLFAGCIEENVFPDAAGVHESHDCTANIRPTGGGQVGVSYQVAQGRLSGVVLLAGDVCGYGADHGIGTGRRQKLRTAR